MMEKHKKVESCILFPSPKDEEDGNKRQTWNLNKSWMKTKKKDFQKGNPMIIRNFEQFNVNKDVRCRVWRLRCTSNDWISWLKVWLGSATLELDLAPTNSILHKSPRCWAAVQQTRSNNSSTASRSVADRTVSSFADKTIVSRQGGNRWVVLNRWADTNRWAIAAWTSGVLHWMITRASVRIERPPWIAANTTKSSTFKWPSSFSSSSFSCSIRVSVHRRLPRNRIAVLEQTILNESVGSKRGLSAATLTGSCIFLRLLLLTLLFLLLFDFVLINSLSKPTCRERALESCSQLVCLLRSLIVQSRSRASKDEQEKYPQLNLCWECWQWKSPTLIKWQRSFIQKNLTRKKKRCKVKGKRMKASVKWEAIEMHSLLTAAHSLVTCGTVERRSKTDLKFWADKLFPPTKPGNTNRLYGLEGACVARSKCARWRSGVKTYENRPILISKSNLIMIKLNRWPLCLCDHK